MRGGKRKAKRGREDGPPKDENPGTETATGSWDNERRDTPAIDRYARALIEYTFDLILLLDRVGKVLYASPSAKRLLGYDPDAVTGRSVFEFLHPDDLERATGFYRSRAGRLGFCRTW